MTTSRPWRWLALLSSGALFGLAVVAAQDSGRTAAPSSDVEAIETPAPVRAVSVIPDAAPSDIDAPPAAVDGEPGHEESFHAASHPRPKPPTRNRPRDFRPDPRFFAPSKSGLMPAEMFTDDDEPKPQGLGTTVPQQANAAPR